MRRHLLNRAWWFHYDTMRYGRGDMRSYAEEIRSYSKIPKENISCSANLVALASRTVNVWSYWQRCKWTFDTPSLPEVWRRQRSRSREKAVGIYRPVKACSKSALPACMQNWILPYVSVLARHAHVFLAFSAPVLHAFMYFLGWMCTTVCILYSPYYYYVTTYSQFYYETVTRS